MEKKDIRKIIEEGDAVIGIEFGSTRIKAVMTDRDGRPLASGGFTWENSQQNGIWTYPLDEVEEGLRACYADLKKKVLDEFGIRITKIAAMGVSGMMHGYLVVDKENRLLTPFRTWRNNITDEASRKLTEFFDYPIPQRWSVAHLYQAILNGEKHVGEIDAMTTLAGWVHHRLSGERVLGIDEASGMFPIDIDRLDYDDKKLSAFDELVSEHGFDWKIGRILPKVLVAGENAGSLSGEGAGLLDPEGDLSPGIPLCPPEGDAGTGMVATASVRSRTGNVSAGTSVFAMIVLEKALSKAHHELDLVTTPDGKLVAMAHSNNCSTEYSAWIELFGEAAALLGIEVSGERLYNTLMTEALRADSDCGGLLAYGYHSGEHMTGFSEGRPLLTRLPSSKLTAGNLIRAQLFTALCALRTGLNILFNEEGVTIDEIKGHGGFFKTPGVGEKIMAAATGTRVSVLETAGEGGAWGIALLAAYMMRKDDSLSLPDFIDAAFEGAESRSAEPEPADVEGFDSFFRRYHQGLAIERSAVENYR